MLINIFDHLPKKTFVYIENDLRHILFDKCIKTTLTALSKEFSLHLKNVSRYRSGIRSVSKEFFINLVQKAKMSLSDFQDKIIIKVGKRGNKLKITTPFDMTSEECRRCGGCMYICPACTLRCEGPKPENVLCGGCENTLQPTCLEPYDNYTCWMGLKGECGTCVKEKTKV